MTLRVGLNKKEASVIDTTSVSIGNICVLVLTLVGVNKKQPHVIDTVGANKKHLCHCASIIDTGWHG